MRLSRLQRYLLSILSGILMVISFPHTGSLFPLIFVAWVPLLLIEHEVYSQKYRSGKFFIHAYLTFLIYNAGASHWIYYSIGGEMGAIDRKSTRLNSSHVRISYAVFCLKKKKNK